MAHSPQKRDSPQRQCRNTLIYGSCRFQDKGCIYYHPPAEASHSTLASYTSPSSPSLSAQAVNAPVFVPQSRDVSATPTAQSAQSLSFAPSVPSFDFQQKDEYYGDVDHLGNFYQQAHQPLNYHLYTKPVPDSFSPSHFISDSLREELQKRSETTYHVPPAPFYLPEELQGYHTILPLEPMSPDRRKLINWSSFVYRGTNMIDGVTYVLRRVENFRLAQQAALSVIESWSRIRHPNIVRVREAFTTRAFNDNSIIVCYDYHPNSRSLFELHLRSRPTAFPLGRMTTCIGTVSEATLWSYIIQIASAIRTVHEAGLAVRVIDPTKILLTGKNRLRIGSCGVIDVLVFDTIQDMALLQQEDLVKFGHVVLTLCCNNLPPINVPQAIDTMSRAYSHDMKALMLYLVSKPTPQKTIAQAMELIGTDRLMREMNEMQSTNDRLETELMGELENGRLVRLLCKFGFINERPEFAWEPRWSETGDRYIIKLFRDYVFHQVDESGNPVVNLSHVLSCLNKLDCGSDERIMLVSRDEQSCLIVSYKEVKSCIEAAFGDLYRASR